MDGAGLNRGELRVFDSEEQLAAAAADLICERARAARGRIAIALSGGTTPRPVYERLARSPLRRRFPWRRVHWFWGDERFVAPSHADSNFRMAHEAMLKHAPVPAENIHAVPIGRSPARAAARYEAMLKDFHGADVLDPSRPLFEINLMGIGADGHTASLFPGEPTLEERARWVVAATHGAPQPRITLTYPALESSRLLLMLVTGAEKRDALHRARSGDPSLPAGRLRPAAEYLWYVDAAAAGAPPILVVMGVSGSGKTTIGRALARKLGWTFKEGDDLHTPRAVARMKSGQPLNDADRRPWLDAIGRWIDAQGAAHRSGVITCSALKRAYRDRLRAGRPQVQFLYLKAAEPVIAGRLRRRRRHFMPASLLHSQFVTLEEPAADERALIVDAGQHSAGESVAAALAQLERT